MPDNQDTSFLVHLKNKFSSQPADDLSGDTYNYFPALIYIVDLARNKVTYINKNRLSKTLGFTNEDLSALEDDMMKLIFQEDLDIVKEELRKFESLSDSEEYCFECRLNHKLGNHRYFRSQGTVLRRNEEGKPASLLFTAEDITETIRSNEEVHALKELIDETENLLDFGSWSWEPRTGRVQCTEGIFKIFGYNKRDAEQEEISFQFYINHIHKKDAAKIESSFTHAVEQKSDFHCRYTIVTKQGQEKYVSSKGKVITDASNEVIKVIGITRDNTKQARINNDLLHYKELILEKEEFLNQGSWEWELKEDVKVWSQGMCRLFGYNGPEEMDALKLYEYLYPLPEDKVIEPLPGQWQQLLEGIESYTIEKTVHTKDGQKKQIETYGKILRDLQGNPEKIIGTSRDVTPLRTYERSLEDKIQELNRSNKELEEFAYVASHDLQEPLRKLTTFSERLTTRFSDQLGPDGKIYLERIGAATENMRVLIENLLEFSRTARSTNHFTQTDLNDVLQMVKADLELKIEETETEISSDRLPEMEVIPSQMKQLFDNLINNSIKFRKKDAPSRIRIKSTLLTADEKDFLHLPVVKNYYKIAFQDNGIGFEQQYAERIFQIFQRLHGKSEYPGSGIGLAICKKIVDNHSGIILAESSPDEGATFTVILPETQTKQSNEFT